MPERRKETMAIVVLKSPPPGVPPRLEVATEGKARGEGTVYFSRNGQYAVKIYHSPGPDKEQLLRTVMNLFRSLPPEQLEFILPPLALTESFDDRLRVGFLMRRVPPRYEDLVKLVISPVAASDQFRRGRTWADYLRMARNVALAVMVLHAKGCAHSDIHYGNFMANIDSGKVVMLDIDGVVVEGFLPPQVRGLLGFMAPEIHTENAWPNEKTDRHSLAVLTLHTLLFRNVMNPMVNYDTDPNLSEEFGFGKFALFSEHPSNHSHRPRSLGLPLYRRGTLSYRMLTPALQRLTERALIDGLRSPGKRPLSVEWERGLADALDELWACSRCAQHFPYPRSTRPLERRACPFCGERLRPPYPAILGLYEQKRRGLFQSLNRCVVLGHAYKLFVDVVETGHRPPPTRKAQPVIGHLEWDRRRGQYRLVCDSGNTWTALQPGRGVVKVSPGQSLEVAFGTSIDFGYGRRALVMDEGGSTARHLPNE